MPLMEFRKHKRNIKIREHTTIIVLYVIGILKAVRFVGIQPSGAASSSFKTDLFTFQSLYTFSWTNDAITH